MLITIGKNEKVLIYKTPKVWETLSGLASWIHPPGSEKPEEVCVFLDVINILYVKYSINKPYQFFGI
jgi:hypothetical protein